MVFLIGAIVTGLLMLVHFFAPGRIELEYVFAPLTLAVSLIIISVIINSIRGIIFHFKAKKILKTYEKN